MGARKFSNFITSFKFRKTNRAPERNLFKKKKSLLQFFWFSMTFVVNLFGYCFNIFRLQAFGDLAHSFLKLQEFLQFWLRRRCGFFLFYFVSHLIWINIIGVICLHIICKLVMPFKELESCKL